MSSITHQELADELREAWVAVSQAHADAMRALRRADHPLVPRFEAYLDQVFEPHSRMLGMQSIESWLEDVARALEGRAEDEEA